MVEDMLTICSDRESFDSGLKLIEALSARTRLEAMAHFRKAGSGKCFFKFIGFIKFLLKMGFHTPLFI
jgi:hypothetical protein